MAMAANDAASTNAAWPANDDADDADLVAITGISSLDLGISLTIRGFSN